MLEAFQQISNLISQFDDAKCIQLQFQNQCVIERTRLCDWATYM